MIRNRFVRILVVGMCAAVALFIVLLVWGGGANSITLQHPAATQNNSPDQRVPQNLTVAVANSLVEKLTPLGRLSDDTNAELAQEKAINSVIDESIKRFNPETFFPTVDEKALSVTADTSTRAGHAYIQTLAKILAVTGGAIPVDATDPAILDFTQPLAAYKTALAALYELPVPRPLLPIHRQAIGIIGAQHTILTALQDHTADPLQAFLAAQSEELVMNRIDALQIDISRYLTAQNS